MTSKAIGKRAKGKRAKGKDRGCTPPLLLEIKNNTTTKEKKNIQIKKHNIEILIFKFFFFQN